MKIEETVNKLNEYFIDKLNTFGATPKGVDYNGADAQVLRFEQLVKIIDPSKSFKVIDYGSGYGAMFDFLQSKNWDFEYYGLDIIEQMVEAGRAAHKDFPNCHFVSQEKNLPKTEYLLAGAIFNIKMKSSKKEWCQFALETLNRMNNLCTRGFSFNMLTSYSDEEKMKERPDLYFADPCFYFDYCKRHFSRNVALLHDYDLYDFTILVRK